MFDAAAQHPRADAPATCRNRWRPKCRSTSQTYIGQKGRFTPFSFLNRVVQGEIVGAAIAVAQNGIGGGAANAATLNI